MLLLQIKIGIYDMIYHCFQDFSGHQFSEKKFYLFFLPIFGSYFVACCCFFSSSSFMAVQLECVAVTDKIWHIIVFQISAAIFWAFVWVIFCHLFWPIFGSLFVFFVGLFLLPFLVFFFVSFFGGRT